VPTRKSVPSAKSPNLNNEEHPLSKVIIFDETFAFLSSFHFQFSFASIVCRLQQLLLSLHSKNHRSNFFDPDQIPKRKNECFCHDVNHVYKVMSSIPERRFLHVSIRCCRFLTHKLFTKFSFGLGLISY
jgi:hypothetical protein